MLGTLLGSRQAMKGKTNGSYSALREQDIFERITSINVKLQLCSCCKEVVSLRPHSQFISRSGQ